MTIPIGYKKLPTGYHDLSISNYFSMVEIELVISDSVEYVYDAFKPWLSYALQPDIQKQLINFMHASPYIPKSFMMSQIKASSEGTHFQVSNIPFSDRPYVICGKQVRKFRFFDNVILNT